MYKREPISPNSAPANVLRTRLHRFWRNHQLLVLPVKHYVLRFEHDIAVDLQVGAAVALHAAEAGSAVDLGEGDHVARHRRRVVVADSHTEVWKLRVAWIGVPTDLGVVFGALHFAVVGLGDGRVDEEK